MSNELLPCPFCGGDAGFYQTSPKTIGHGESEDDVGVRCLGCKVSVFRSFYAGSKIEERKDITKYQWNQRI